MASPRNQDENPDGHASDAAVSEAIVSSSLALQISTYPTVSSPWAGRSRGPVDKLVAPTVMEVAQREVVLVRGSVIPRSSHGELRAHTPEWPAEADALEDVFHFLDSFAPPIRPEPINIP